MRCHVEHPVVSMRELYSKDKFELLLYKINTFVWACQADKNMKMMKMWLSMAYTMLF